MKISEFFTEHEKVLMHRYKNNSDSLRRDEYEELWKAFSRFVDAPPQEAPRSLVGEAKHIEAILKGRMVEKDTQNQIRTISAKQALW